MRTHDATLQQWRPVVANWGAIGRLDVRLGLIFDLKISSPFDCAAPVLVTYVLASEGCLWETQDLVLGIWLADNHARMFERRFSKFAIRIDEVRMVEYWAVWKPCPELLCGDQPFCLTDFDIGGRRQLDR